MLARKLTEMCLATSILVLSPAAALTAETLVIVGSTLIDVGEFGNGDSDLEDSVIVIEDGLITAVVKRSDFAIPTDARVLEAEGTYMVPGLTDGFAALNNQSYADAYLECGVTSIIAVSGGRRGPLATGLDPSPRVSRLGSVGDEPGRLADHISDLEGLASQDVEVALLMYELSPPQLQALIQRANELGLSTIGELGRTSYAVGVESGLNAVVHTTRYSLDMAPEALAGAVADQPFSDDLESPKWRYYTWLSELSPHDDRLSDHARILAGGTAALMPTFSLLHLDRPWASNPWEDRAARHLDPGDINAPASAETGRHTYDAAHQVAYSAVARAQFLVEEAYHRAGARYLAGSATDVWGTMPGISLHTELESLVRLGLTPRQALAAATSNFAAVFPNWGRRGEIKAGWKADLLLLDKDPRTDIRHLRAIARVIQQGRIVETTGHHDLEGNGD